MATSKRIPGLPELMSQAPAALGGIAAPPPSGDIGVYAPQPRTANIPSYYRPQQPTANTPSYYRQQPARPGPMSLPQSQLPPQQETPPLPRRPMSSQPQQPQGQPLRSMVIPGSSRDVPVGRTESTKLLTPRAWQAGDEVGAALDEYGQALTWERETEAMHMENQIGLYEQKADLARDAATRRADRSLKTKNVAEEYKQRRENLMQDVGGMEIKDFWASKNTGEKIFAAIGLALGGFSSAVTGQPNPAMQIIDNAIARDLDIQKANIKQGRLKLEDLNGSYAVIRQDIDDEQRADDLYHLASLEQVEQQLQQLKLHATVDEKRQSVDTVLAEIGVKKAERQQNLALAEGIAVNEQIKRVTTGTRIITPEDQMGMQDYNPKTWIPFLQGNARGGETNVRKLLDFGRDSQQLISLYDEMLDYRSKWSNFSDLEKRKAVERMTKRTTVIEKLKSQMGAALTENEERLIVVKDTEDATEFLASADLEQMKKNLMLEIKANKGEMVFTVKPSTIPVVERRSDPRQKAAIQEYLTPVEPQ